MSQPTQSGRAFVVDASVGVKLFVLEPLSEQAHLLFGRGHAGPPPTLLVPDLFFIECTNVLWKQARRWGVPAALLQENLRELGHLSLQSFPTRALIGPALDLALTWGISAYDACYAALAQQRGLPLVTADQKLLDRLAKAEVRVLWLGDLPANPH